MLRPTDWINFAFVSCQTCSRVQVATCNNGNGSGGLQCVPCIPVVGSSSMTCNQQKRKEGEHSALQCADAHCDECYYQHSSAATVTATPEQLSSSSFCQDCSAKSTTTKAEDDDTDDDQKGTTQIEIFRAQVEEVIYLNQVWHKNLPETILHSMMFCPCCRAVGFPGSENHLTIHGGQEGQELMHTNPAYPGKLGRPTNWRLVHTDNCPRDSQSKSKKRSAERYDLARLAHQPQRTLALMVEQQPCSRLGARQLGQSLFSEEEEEEEGPNLFTIKIDRTEAVRFMELVTDDGKGTINMNQASLLALSLSKTRYLRRQQRLSKRWDCELMKLHQHAATLVSQQLASSKSVSSKCLMTKCLMTKCLMTKCLMKGMSVMRKLVCDEMYHVNRERRMMLIGEMRQIQQLLFRHGESESIESEKSSEGSASGDGDDSEGNAVYNWNVATCFGRLLREIMKQEV